MDLTVSMVLTGDSDSEIDDLRGDLDDISLETKKVTRRGGRRKKKYNYTNTNSIVQQQILQELPWGDELALDDGWPYTMSKL